MKCNAIVNQSDLKGLLTCNARKGFAENYSLGSYCQQIKCGYLLEGALT